MNASALGAWEVSRVTDVHSMFREARAFNQALEAWEVSRVTDMEDMFSLLTVPMEVDDRVRARPLEVAHGEVAFENVNFSYDERRSILHNVSFTVPSGKTVAIVGPSGAGKSLTMRCILGLTRPDDGRVILREPDGTAHELSAARGRQLRALRRKTACRSSRSSAAPWSAQRVAASCTARRSMPLWSPSWCPPATDAVRRRRCWSSCVLRPQCTPSRLTRCLPGCCWRTPPPSGRWRTGSSRTRASRGAGRGERAGAAGGDARPRRGWRRGRRLRQRKPVGAGEHAAELARDVRALEAQVEEAMSTAVGGRAFSIPKVDSVGPKVGGELRRKGFQAMLFTLALVLVYIAFRFDLTFAPGAIVALFHDVSITLGIFVVIQEEVNLSMIGALLTIIGYSLNDTIVIYDRMIAA